VLAPRPHRVAVAELTAAASGFCWCRSSSHPSRLGSAGLRATAGPGPAVPVTAGEPREMTDVARPAARASGRSTSRSLLRAALRVLRLRQPSRVAIGRSNTSRRSGPRSAGWPRGSAVSSWTPSSSAADAELHRPGRLGGLLDEVRAGFALAPVARSRSRPILQHLRGACRDVLEAGFNRVRPRHPEPGAGHPHLSSVVSTIASEPRRRRRVRRAGFSRISCDLIYAVPGSTTPAGVRPWSGSRPSVRATSPLTS